jgi:hypothetical protein
MTPSRPRTEPHIFSNRIDHQLTVYALAATAAGVSLLALAEPSEAKIIYTKSHKVIKTNNIYPLDVNHDRSIDFLIQEAGFPFSGTSFGFNGLYAKGAFGNGVRGSKNLASALNQGVPIGPHQQFINSTSSGYGVVMFQARCGGEGSCTTSGKWANVNNRYLGLKFRIHGKTHYGWARLNVTVTQQRQITATLTGYAYETIPNQGIHAGQTHDTDDLSANSEANSSGLSSPGMVPVSPALRPVSLGGLARGLR